MERSPGVFATIGVLVTHYVLKFLYGAVSDWLYVHDVL